MSYFTRTEKPANQPTIVVLCGSTRFADEFRKANLSETLAGHIVLSIGCDLRTDGMWMDPEELEQVKVKLDELHKRKIDLADEVLVLNVGGYVGDSTLSEIEYAKKLGKPIRWLESSSVCDLCQDPTDRITAVACLHVVEGETCEDNDGNSMIAKYQDSFDDVPQWLCPEKDCPEFRVCGECGSNFPAKADDVKAALARQARRLGEGDH